MRICSKRWLAILALSASLSGYAQPGIPLQWFDFPPGPTDPPAFATAYGSLPLAYTSNLISAPVPLDPDWYWPNALILDTTNLAPAFIQYAVTDSNNVHNFSYDPGTVLFYFCPNWASVSQGSGATGPGETAYFIGSGDWSSGSPNGLFTIYADAYGSNIYVAGVGSGVTNIYASAPISWASNTFHQIGVEWSSSGSTRNPGIKMYLDGTLAATGLKLSIVPAMGTDSNGVWTNALFVGSDNNGTESMRGAMWSLTTWNCMYGGWYADDWPVISNALAAWQASPGGGFGGMMGSPSGAMGQSGGPSYVIPATNYIDYNQFWVTTSLTNLTNVLVTITNTLSNLTYTILTNYALGSNAPPSGIFATLTATNPSIVVSNAIPFVTNPFFVHAGLVWNTSTNNSPLPDWLSMSLYGRLSIPTVGGYITNGLAAYWKMNETNGTIAHDSSGNGLDLPLSNSPSWGSNCLILNGTSQYGDAGSNGFASLDTNDFTICAWISNTGSSKEVIASKWDSMNSAGWSLDVLTNGLLDMYVDGNADVMTNTGPSTVPSGQWTFVAVVWHNVPGDYKADFYFDGVLDSSQINGQPIQRSSGSAHVVVGGLFEGTGAFFAGSMHDVAIYNRALTSWEIGFNFLSSEFVTTVTPPDLLYYKMTEYGETTNYPLKLTNSVTNGAAATGYLWDTNEGPPDWTTGPGGIPNTAIHFHGESTYITTSNSTAFDFTTNLFTINLWVEPTSSSDHYLMQNQDTSGTNGWFMRYDANYRALFGTLTNTIGGTNTILTPKTGSVQNLTWDMVTVVRTSLTNAIIYVNGVEAVSGYITSPGSSTNTLKLGIDAASTNDLDGNLWLPQIWSTKLSPTDIANLYYNQVRGKPWP